MVVTCEAMNTNDSLKSSAVGKRGRQSSTDQYTDRPIDLAAEWVVPRFEGSGFLNYQLTRKGKAIPIHRM